MLNLTSLLIGKFNAVNWKRLTFLHLSFLGGGDGRTLGGEGGGGAWVLNFQPEGSNWNRVKQ